MTHTSPLPSRTGQLYVSAVIVAGVLAVMHSLNELFNEPVTYHWFILAGLTLLSGSFTIRIPTIPARLSVSETFVFAAVLLFGASAATMIVVLDSLIISLWLKERSRGAARVLFNMAAPSVAIWIASHAFFQLADIEPLAQRPQPILTLVAPLLVLALVYFLLNSLLIARAIAFEKQTSTLRVWRQNFLWLSLNYFSGASVAALLLPYLQADYDDFFRVIGVLLPLLLISYLTFKTALGRVDDANRHLSELNRLYLSTIETLAMAIDAKDQITHGHIRRVQTYAVQLARAVGVTDNEQIRAIEAAALLHDMGKLAVPEYILNKPGALTPAEFERMKLHASVGADILSAIAFPYPVVPIVRHHHENWNGTGYPDGLGGADIPMGARVLSVVDCYDALTSDRPYRPRLPEEDAIKILLDRRGTMYDPLVVDTFLKIHPDLMWQERGGERVLPSLAAITDAAVPPRVSDPALRSLDEITASADEMLSIFEVSKALADQVTFVDAGEVILRHLRRLIPYSSATFYVYDLDADELVSRLAFGEHASLLRGIRIPLGQRLAGWVGANRQSIRNSDPVLDLGEVARSLDPRPRSALTVPLVDRIGLVGTLSLYSEKHDGFSADHQRVAEVLAPHVAPVVRRAVEFTAARDISLRDPVTGLPNAEQLKIFVQTASAWVSHDFAIILVVLPNLSTVRARHGQEVLDGVLTDVTDILKQHLRPADVVFKYSNQEFVHILFKSGSEDAAALAQELRGDLHRAVNITDLCHSVEVTTASAPADGVNVDQLIASARSRRANGRIRRASSKGKSDEAVH